MTETRDYIFTDEIGPDLEDVECPSCKEWILADTYYMYFRGPREASCRKCGTTLKVYHDCCWNPLTREDYCINWLEML